MNLLGLGVAIALSFSARDADVGNIPDHEVSFQVEIGEALWCKFDKELQDGQPESSQEAKLAKTIGKVITAGLDLDYRRKTEDDLERLDFMTTLAWDKAPYYLAACYTGMSDHGDYADNQQYKVMAQTAGFRVGVVLDIDQDGAGAALLGVEAEQLIGILKAAFRYSDDMQDKQRADLKVSGKGKIGERIEIKAKGDYRRVNGSADYSRGSVRVDLDYLLTRWLSWGIFGKGNMASGTDPDWQVKTGIKARL